MQTSTGSAQAMTDFPSAAVREAIASNGLDDRQTGILANDVQRVRDGTLSWPGIDPRSGQAYPRWSSRLGVVNATDRFDWATLASAPASPSRACWSPGAPRSPPAESAARPPPSGRGNPIRHKRVSMVRLCLPRSFGQPAERGLLDTICWPTVEGRLLQVSARM